MRTDDRGSAGLLDEQRIEAAAQLLAQELGFEAIQVAKREPALLATKADGFDLVTAADREIERRARVRIGEVFPHHGILGEEEGHSAGLGDWTWVVDPVDGTFNFVTGLLGGSACSVALLRAQEVRVGAVADFASGRVYSARRGHGVFLDGTPLRDPPQVSLIGKSRLFVEFGMESLSRELAGTLSLFAAAQPVVPRMIGSAAVALLAIALRGGVFAGVGLRLWDVAAGVLLAEERGNITHWWNDEHDRVHVLVGAAKQVDAFRAVVVEAINFWRAQANG